MVAGSAVDSTHDNHMTITIGTAVAAGPVVPRILVRMQLSQPEAARSIHVVLWLASLWVPKKSTSFRGMLEMCWIFVYPCDAGSHFEGQSHMTFQQKREKWEKHRIR